MDIKYLIDGTEVEVISETKDGQFVVTELYETDCGDYATGPALVVERVFDEPPTKVYSEQITQLKAEINLLEKQRREIEAEIKKENPVFVQFRDLMAGKYTHALLYSDDYMTVIQLEELSKDRDGKNTLILSGSIKYGQWSWRALYGDYHRDIQFFKAKSEALLEAQRIISQKASGTFGRVSDNVIDFALKNGLTVPQKFIDESREYKRRAIQHQIFYYSQTAIEYQEKVEQYKEKLAQLDG